MKVAVTILTFVTGTSVTRTRWNHARVLIWNISFWFVSRYNILPSIIIFCVSETGRMCWFPDLLGEVMARFAKRSITSTIPPGIFSIKHILCWTEDKQPTQITGSWDPILNPNTCECGFLRIRLIPTLADFCYKDIFTMIQIRQSLYFFSCVLIVRRSWCQLRCFIKRCRAKSCIYTETRISHQIQFSRVSKK